MSVSTTPLPGDTASGRSGPSIWRRVLYPRSPFGLVARFSATHKRNYRTAISRVRDPKPIPWPPGTTSGPGSSLSDIRRVSLEGKGRRT